MKAEPDGAKLVRDIRRWAQALGFDEIGIANTDLSGHEARLMQWLNEGMHGDMEFMARHGTKRCHPTELIPDTISIISVRMNYLPQQTILPQQVLRQPTTAYIARYALGRDYHKLMRKRLQKLADRIERSIGTFCYRAFVDSAPVMEKAIAEKAGLGWTGKHTLNLNRETGSWYFLGELYTNLPLPVSKPTQKHCGDCKRCIDVCPTHAIVAPYRLDAKRCIAYLTIELKGSIPVDLRPLIGNRIFGCDDCQLVCPWNRFAKTSADPAFQVKNKLDSSELIDLFKWTEQEFVARTQGTVLYRLGYERWLRNIAVGLGNAPYSADIVTALIVRSDYPSALVQEHVTWAIDQQENAHSKQSETPRI